MLGCFVGPAETAARGVPDRFLNKANIETTRVPPQEGSSKEKKETVKTAPVNNVAPSTQRMASPIDVDK